MATLCLTIPPIYIMTSKLLTVSIVAFALFTSNSVAGSRTSDSADVEAESAEMRERPAEWMWQQRAYPSDVINPQARLDAVRQAQALRVRAHAKGGAIASTEWQQAGPTNIGGRIVDIEFNPVNPAIVYAAAAQGGVFRSDDTGRTWRPLFDDMPVISMGDIAVDPSNPEIIYAGTGEANSQHNAFPGLGVFKSTDGGATWRHLGLEKTDAIGRILVHPVNSQRVYVAALGSAFLPHPERGVWRSDDGGETWKRVLFVNDSTGAVDIAFDPAEPDLLYAAMWQRSRRPEKRMHYGSASGIYRSLDGGDTWERLEPSTGLPNSSAVNVGRIGLAVAPVTGKVYAFYSDGYQHLGLFSSDTYGESWNETDPTKALGKDSADFKWYFGQVRVDPQDDSRVYVLDVDFARSDDNGQNWMTQGYAEMFETGLHVDHHALAFHPKNPNYIIVGNDGGISISRDRGDTWEHIKGMPITQFYEVGIDLSNPERLYGGTQDNNTIRTISGQDDDWQSILGGDGFYVIVDPDDPSLIYAESQYGGLWRLFDTGDNIEYEWGTNGIPPTDEEPRNWSTPVVMDPNNRVTLYYGTTRIYRTNNAAGDWVAISDPLGKHIGHSQIGTVTTIAIAPTDSRVIYAGTDDGNVWVSSNYGQSWQNISSSLPERWVTRIVVDPYDKSTAYITYSGLKWREQIPYVFRTTDMGEHWEDISANLPAAPVNAFAIDPRRPSVLYLGSDVGMFVSFNGGGAWEPLGTGMPIVPVADIKIYPNAQYMVVGTHGRSMYKLDISLVVSAGEQPDEPSGLHVHTFPNPCTDFVFFEYDVPTASRVTLDIYDIAGRKLASPVAGMRQPGTFSARWNCIDTEGRGLLPGVYVYRLTVAGQEGEKQLAGKFTVVR